MSNFRMYACERPQIGQRLCCRTANLGFLVALTINDVRAKVLLLSYSPIGKLITLLRFVQSVQPVRAFHGERTAYPCDVATHERDRRFLPS